MSTRLSLLITAAVLLVPLAVACSSSGDNGQTGDDQNITAQVGHMCGGLAGIRCAAGSTCQMQQTQASDASGTCVASPAQPPGTLHGLCAGFEGIQCKAGLHCLVLAGPLVGDASGTCESADTVLVEGTLHQVMGMGGETTGFAVSTDSGSSELVLTAAQRDAFIEGHFARIVGQKTTLSGVETHNRPAINVSDILACPNAGTIDCMPPNVPASCELNNRGWIASKCQGVHFVD